VEISGLFNLNLPEYIYRRDGTRTHARSLAVWQRESADNKYLILLEFHKDIKAI